MSGPKKNMNDHMVGVVCCPDDDKSGHVVGMMGGSGWVGWLAAYLPVTSHD